jgi:serine/threonine protein kinase
VYKAVHKVTKEPRAIKLIDKSIVPKDKEKELFSEIKVLKEMDHPRIMRIFEFSSDEKYYYLVSE